MSSKAIEGAKAEVTISYADGRKRTFDLTSVSFGERLPADGSCPTFSLEGKVVVRSILFRTTLAALQSPVSYPTPHKTCICDIKDLMSTGHRSGCPEKKG